MAWFKKYIFEVVLVLLAAGFFVVYQFLYWDFYAQPLSADVATQESAYLIFNQPDEMANYLFIRQWVLHHKIGMEEALSGVALNQLHPRSMTVVNGELMPIGFPGFIVLLAFAMKAITFFNDGSLFNYFVVMITPLSAVTAPLFLYGIIRRLFDDRSLAFLSAIGLFFLPPWWYYASRPLQHMTLFVTLFLVATYFLIKYKNKSVQLFLFTFFWGLALYIRPTEWLWTLFLFTSLFIFLKPKLNISGILSGIIAMSVVGVLFFVTQNAFYGNLFASGYVRPQLNGAGGLITSGPQGIPLLNAIFLPFGWHPLIILKTIYNYGFKLIAPWTVAAIIGFGLTLYERQKIWRYYSIVFGGVVFLILLYYGSWNFADNLAGLVSIGSSQTRYFLPLYVLSLPFVAFLLKKLWTLTKTGQLCAIMIFFALALFSFKAVFLRFEGLAEIKNTVAGYYDWRSRIYEATPSSAIVVTRYGDKYLFPGRRVLVNWQGEEEIQAMAKLAMLGFPLYWYDIELSQKDKAEMETKWRSTELTLSEPIAVWDNLELRPVKRVENLGEKK